MRNSVFAIAVGAFSLFSIGTGAIAEVVLNYAEASPPRGIRAAALQWYADEVERRSNGDLKLNITWSGALMDSKTARQGIADGVADMGTVVGAYTPKESIPTAFTELPIIKPDSYIGAMAAYDTINGVSAIQEGLRKDNLILLSNFTYVPAVIVCAGEPIETLADVPGKKIRATQFFGRVMGELGANVVNQSVYQSYQALDTGLVTCTQAYADFTKALRLYEVADQLTLVNWGQAAQIFIMINADVFDGLSEEHQNLLAEVGRDVVVWNSVKLRGADAEALREFQEGIEGHKMEIHTLPEADTAFLLEQGQIAKDDWIQSANDAGYPGDEIISTYLAAIERYAAEVAASGYPKVD